MEDVIVKKHRGNSVEYHFEKRPVEGSTKGMLELPPLLFPPSVLI